MTQRVERIASTGERRDALSQEWAAVAEESGFLPLLLPNRRSTVQALLEDLKPEGVLLTGGNDLLSCGGDAPERDETEHFLIDWALERRVPLLGVCRGCQMLLDHFGTPLRRVEGHIRVEHLLSDGRRVNSFHGWGAETCRPPLEVLARSEDGIVEAVRHRDCPWIQGVMYHPERYSPLREQDLSFIREALEL